MAKETDALPQRGVPSCANLWRFNSSHEVRILEDTWRVGLNPTGNPFQFSFSHNNGQGLGREILFEKSSGWVARG